jgi:hypothetical protein
MTGTRFLALVVIALSRTIAPVDALGQLIPVGPEYQANTYTTGTQTQPAVGSDAMGNFVVVWESHGSDGTDTADSSVQGQRYDDTGAPLGTQFQVNTYTTSFQGHPDVAVDADGDFLVVWWSGGSSGSDTSLESIQGRWFDATGTPMGPDFQVNAFTTNRQVFANVAADGLGSFVVVWGSDGSPGSDHSGYSIQAQRYDALGAPSGGQFQVNTYTTGHTEWPAVACDGAGRCAVVWGSEHGAGTDPNFSIEAQLYGALGAPDGSQFQANTGDTTNYQSLPDVAFDGPGNFVVVWFSVVPFAAPDLIRGQRFDSDGTAIGAGFQADTAGVPQLWPPHVTADGGGNFAVVWASTGVAPDAPDGSIEGRLFDALDTPIGGQFQVNGYTTGTQLFPAVNVDANGTYVVAWESPGGTGTDTTDGGVQLRRFVGPPTTTSSSVTSTTSSSSTTSTSSTLPTTDLLDGRLVIVKPGALAKFVAKPAPGDAFALPFGDPGGLAGGTLRVFDTTAATAGDETYVLQSGGWRGLGRPAGANGYRYKGAGSVSDPCRVVVVKERVVKAMCVGTGVTLTPPFAGDVAIVLSFGTTDRYCARFGGEEVRNDPTLTRKRNAPAPGACP